MAVIQRMVWTFLAAMVPAVEVKGAIPFGIALSLKPAQSYAMALAGSFIVVCFLAFFTNWFYRACKRRGVFRRLIGWIDRIVSEHQDKIKRFGPLAVFAYVAVPVPGTGTWTGSIIAGALNLRPRHIILSVMGGNFVSGFIMTAASTGVAHLLAAI